MKKIDFCDGWEFKSGDREWEKVIIPHDAQLLDKRDKNAPGGSGHGFFSCY
ncbi:MAG: hypothetical protein J6X48_02575 [Lachnospiraceae bacterium]|nr:hypothetical protein [Lachnospiraceae bacterium]MBP5599143.1 hypothetical protein [Lachnospiraceae bacterium]